MSSTRPGVEITQVISQTPVTTLTPVLVPAVVGVCRQIVEAFTADGSVNTDARYTTERYHQASLLISPSAFPDPRGIVDEVDIENDTVAAYLRYGGRMVSLPRGSHGTYGSAFLKAVNGATRAAFRMFGTGWTFATDARFVLAVDEPTASEANDLQIDIDAGTYTGEELAAAINAQVPTDIAFVFTDGMASGVQLVSPTYGARSSLAIRAGGDALPDLFDGDLDAAASYRVVGAGFRGQDDGDGDYVTPWIEWAVGSYEVDGESESTWASFAGQVDADEVFVSDATAPVTFTGASATVPLRAATNAIPGDQFWADGVRIAGAEVTKVEARRFKIGTLSNTLSTFDEDGVATTRVYEPVEVNIPLHSSALAPRYAYFRADGLTGTADPMATVATLAGEATGLAARPALVQGDEVAVTAGDPLRVGGTTLEYTLTIDGVEQDTVTYALPNAVFESWADFLAAVETSFPGLSVSVVTDAWGSGGDYKRLVFTTTRTGAGQSIAFSAAGTANGMLGLPTDAPLADTGVDVTFASPAEVLYTAPDAPTNGSYTVLVVVEDSKGVHTISTSVALLDTMSDVDVAEVIEDELGTNLADGGLAIATVTRDGATLAFTTIEGGASVGIALTVGSGLLEAVGVDGLKDTALSIYLDGMETAVEVPFITNSLADAVFAINEAVDGAADVAAESDGALTLSSLLLGAASMLHVSGTATTPLDLSTDPVAGTGRPLADFFVDSDEVVNLGAGILRNPATGTPIWMAPTAGVFAYLAYRGIRRDVTASAASPALLAFATMEEMDTAIGPVHADNPLAVGCYLALLNSTTSTVYALGVDEVTGAAPNGTLDAWSRALEFLEQKEVYAIAPLTDDAYIHGLCAEHVTVMSEPANRAERIVIFAPAVPERTASTTIMSGQDGSTTGVANTFVLDDSPLTELVAAGITGPAVTYAANLYLEVVVVTGGASELRRYSVSNVNNTLLTLRTSFTADQNTDGFFATASLTEELTGADYTLAVRGERLVVAGTSRTDLGAVATAGGAQGAAYTNRRVYSVFAGSIDTSIDGVTQNLPAFYACAAIAGMVGQQSPQQPFTNVPMVGIGKVYGTEDTFSEVQLDTIADGGRYVLVNQNGRVSCRHQRSTATSSVEYRELSITKAIDWVAKILRTTNRAFIGRYVITPGFIDQLSMSNEGVLARAVQLGVVNAASLASIAQSEEEPDVVLIEVEVAPAYPCNRIKITIVT